MANKLTRPQRLATLHKLNLLDTPADPRFDRFTRLASQLLSSPIALVSLVDEQRQFFKSCFGLHEPWNSLRGTPLSHSFCQYAVDSGEPLVVNDAKLDPNFCNNLAVTEIGVAAYLGIPIKATNGEILGSFCVIDGEPRQWTQQDISSLADLTLMLEEEFALLERVSMTNELSNRKSIFLAELSHELRNPLTPIYSAAQLLNSGLLEESQKPEISRILLDQTRQVICIVDGLLDLSRIENGKIVLDRSPVDLHQIIDCSLEATKDLLDAKSHNLHRDENSLPSPSREAVWVTGDASRLTQVITNLLTNACRYAPAGGNIQVECFAENDLGKIIVTDDGKGLSETELESVFTLFNQASELKANNKGLGIGLALVKQLVELHSGTVTAQSQGLGKGCCITVSLPLGDDPIAVADEEDSHASTYQPAAKPLKILVVDDQRSNTYLLKALLETGGHQVHAAENVEQAWEFIAQSVPNVILSDIQMPGVDGYEFIRQLRDDNRTRALRVLAVTGQAEPKFASAIKASGFDDLITKPIDMATLFDKLSN